jgi:signal peptidase
VTLARRIAISAFALLVVVVGGGALYLWHAGYRAYVVHTGSMMPTLNPGDLIIDKRPGGQVKPGEVITFRHSAQTTDVVTHRVTDVSAQGIHTKGDANGSADVWDIRPDQVRGRVVGNVPYLGYLLVYLRQPTGSASLLAALAGVFALWGLFFGKAEPAIRRGLHRAPRERAFRSRPAGRHALVPTGIA